MASKGRVENVRKAALGDIKNHMSTPSGVETKPSNRPMFSTPQVAKKNIQRMFDGPDEDGVPLQPVEMTNFYYDNQKFEEFLSELDWNGGRASPMPPPMMDAFDLDDGNFSMPEPALKIPDFLPMPEDDGSDIESLPHLEPIVHAAAPRDWKAYNDEWDRFLNNDESGIGDDTSATDLDHSVLIMFWKSIRQTILL